MASRRPESARGAKAPSTPAASPEPRQNSARPSGRLRLALTGTVTAIVLLIYLATGAPGAWWGDGLEFACAAWTRGIPHPTGYPLYTNIGYLVMKTLRWLDPGRALTVFGAVLLATSLGLLIPLFQRLISASADRSAEDAPDELGIRGLLPATGLALLVAFATTVWENATFTDVFPLTFFLGALILRLAWTGRHRQPGIGRALAMGLVVGLGLINHYCFLAVVPLATFCVLRWAYRSSRPWRMIAGSLGCALAVMLLGYLYLILRARANPLLNWGDPSTLGRLTWTLRGGQFTQLKVQAGEMPVVAGLARWLYWWGTQWISEDRLAAAPGIILGAATVGTALAGLVRLARRRWELGLGLLAAIGATAGYAALYHIPDIDSYFMIALPAAAIGWLVAIQWLLGRLRRTNPDFMRRPITHALPAILALSVILAHYHIEDKSWDTGPSNWGRTVLDALPKDAIVITGGDADIYSLWYQQMVRGVRPDVSVVGSNFIFYSWYKKYFAAGGRPKVPLVIEDREPGLKLTFDVALFSGVILPNMAAHRPVYVTYYDPLFAEYLAPQKVANLLPPTYRDICTYPARYLPLDTLYKLTPSPALAAMDKDQLTDEFMGYYRRKL